MKPQVGVVIFRERCSMLHCVNSVNENWFALDLKHGPHFYDIPRFCVQGTFQIPLSTAFEYLLRGRCCFL